MIKKAIIEQAKRAIRVELDLVDWEAALDYVLEDNPDMDKDELRTELNKRLAIIENKLW